MGWLSNFVSNPVKTVTNTVKKAVDVVGNAGQKIIDTAKEHPLETAALVAAGYYYQPEISAWVNSSGTALPGTEAGVAAGTTPTTTAALSSADKAALYGNSGYGAGMTGAETAAYDTGLTTGAAGAAGAATKAATTGSTLSDILPYTAGASVAGSLINANAAKDAANIQADAATKAIEQQQKNFETIRADQAPYRATGYGALNEIAKLNSGQTPVYDYNGNIVKDSSGNPVMTTGSGYLTHQFSPEDLQAGIDPGYNFRLQQGQMANQRASNVAGGGIGGNALKGLQDYTQNLASTEYGNAFNRYQVQRNNIYNTLASIAGIGQTGQTETNKAGTSATNASTELSVGSAAANAGATKGVANAYGNAISDIADKYTLAEILKQRGNVVVP